MLDALQFPRKTDRSLIRKVVGVNSSGCRLYEFRLGIEIGRRLTQEARAPWVHSLLALWPQIETYEIIRHVVANSGDEGGWLEQIMQFASQWGDLSSIVGLFLAIIGFGFTLWGVWRSKSAAEAARDAAQKAKDAIVHLQTIMDFSAAIIMMEEIKRLHRVSVD
jgi:hypothetical protein